MNQISKNLNILLGGGLLGAVVISLVATKAIALLFTAPVSFGVNCEPAGNWAMQKLMAVQGLGLIGGMIGAFVLKAKLFKKKVADTTPSVKN